jgi:hypothetical protein
LIAAAAADRGAASAVVVAHVLSADAKFGGIEKVEGGDITEEIGCEH